MASKSYFPWTSGVWGAVTFGAVGYFLAAGAPAEPGLPPADAARQSDLDETSLDGVWISARGNLEWSNTVAPALVAGDIRIPLRFSDRIKVDALKLGRLRIRGYLVPDQPRAHDAAPPWVCMVTSVTQDEASDAERGLLAGLQKHKQMMVKYRPGRGADVERKCKELGLDVIDRHGAGQLFVCSWPPGTDLEGALKDLLAYPGVEYVEPNYEISIDPLERPRLGKPPR